MRDIDPAKPNNGGCEARTIGQQRQGRSKGDIPTRRIHRNQPLTPIPRILRPKSLNTCMILVGVMMIRAMMAVT
jgi:hypothetical protein